jgi:hypothetical protein
MNKPFTLPAHSQVREPDLLFHPERQQDRDPHPLKGLLQFGPFSRSLINQVLDPIRIATIFPSSFKGRVNSLLRELEQRHYPRERKNYLIEFPGFSRIFGLRVTPAAQEAQVELPPSIEGEILNAKHPHLRLADILTSTVNRLNVVRHEFDVLMIFLPERWGPPFSEKKTTSICTTTSKPLMLLEALLHSLC